MFDPSADFPAARYVDVEGVRTAIYEAGSGDPLILVHGGGAGADSFGNFGQSISAFAAGHRVICVDMLGFGNTAKPEGIEYSQSARIRHMIGVVEALRLEKPPVMIGNSMGGATSMGVAIERPELVRALVLMGSAGLNRDLGPVQAIVNFDFTREGMVKLVDALTHDSFQVSDALIDYRLEMATRPDTRRAYGATMQWIKGNGGLHYEESYIARVTHPTLVVHGKDDKVVPITAAFDFLRLIPQSWGTIIPRCGHWAMIEHPHDFARGTLAFVDQLDAPH